MYAQLKTLFSPVFMLCCPPTGALEAGAECHSPPHPLLHIDLPLPPSPLRRGPGGGSVGPFFEAWHIFASCVSRGKGGGGGIIKGIVGGRVGGISKGIG